ncbi:MULTISPECIES: Stk1 family PASTA domain-containing Ser/Thr kinase [Hungatella]|uniref:non-specific serine/threonine protein kinase n=1 Tax=Hungatella hathewayi TaxID=154046 RepID=A0AAW9W985_9FIRM|nr:MULTISPECIES: Stk1 family PASTA domain-containing Ser/Thr kinase [Hungatella]MCQ4827450.1 Stk1 family PASTA domain-containing Ser/Thr kinase [Hungatella sp. SL.1.14]MUB61570.1 Stk1 family PASTA domain-containing Ser/Thr kinase [Hungatella hathewayi]CUP01043.1 serine/threonine protein kinase with PASTA sensor(s) [Hungatella hathewayi]
MILRPGTFLQDRYEILDKIGSGGMSDVYKALCHKLKRQVAIKVLKEEFSSDSGFVSKFKMEAQAAARLSHPNIVNVYDVVDEGTLHYIVMELIEGITLKNYILKKGCLDSKEAIGIAIQVAQGIAAAHEQGIVHRDIKPQNIIIARDGKVKVADFGIARAASTQTLSATAMGSVHYISPEQARGGYSDARSDIYSLGITMYEMAAGRVPFEGENTVTVALAHLEDPITPPSYFNQEIPVSFENIILKCTEKKPEYRYGSMQEVIADLRRALVTPDENFVQASAPSMDTSQTVIIGAPELEQIRSGSGRRNQPEPQPGRNRSYGGEPVRERQPEHRSSRNTSGGRTKRKEPDEEINPGIEKLLTAAGIVVAILIVIVLIFLVTRLGGLFRSGTPKETETTVETTQEETTLGEKQTTMPEVEGLAEDIARQKLRENGGLDMKIGDYEFSDTVKKGDVISQTPKAGEIVDRYSAVSVVISSGPEHPEIDLTTLGLDSLTAEAAKTLLEGKGFIVNLQNQSSDTVESGKIISYSPSKAKEGAVISVIASTGPALTNPVVVPDITGKEEEVGEEMLADLGLVRGTVTKETSEEVPAGTIIRQTIAPNTQVEGGTAIDYVVSSGSAEQAKYKYLASIEKSYPLQNLIGPGSASTQLNIKIQLKQTVNGKDEFRDLMGPVTITGDQQLPVVFKNIEGAYGVTSGEVQIVNVDTGDVINSYPVTFVPIPQS